MREKEKWEQFWDGVKLPQISTPSEDIRQQLVSVLSPAGTGLSFIEIGCAPGAWMAYFNRQFGYQVSGVEYAEAAASATRENCRILGVQSEIIVQDFLTWDYGHRRFDIVFSAGFIEHFTEPDQVMKRICDLSSRYVVTLVPNLLGFNGWIRKATSPERYAEHTVINPAVLEGLHQGCGMKTVFCGYAGGLELVPPWAGSRFYYEFLSRNRRLTQLFYSPVILVNRLSSLSGRVLKRTLNGRRSSNYLLYIGERLEPNNDVSEPR